MYFTLSNYCNNWNYFDSIKISYLLFSASALSFIFDNNLEGGLFLTSAFSILYFDTINHYSSRHKDVIKPTIDFKLKIVELSDKLPNTLPEPYFKSTTETIDGEEFESVPDPGLYEIQEAIIGTSFLKSEKILKEMGYTLEITNKDALNTLIISDSSNKIYVQVYDKGWLGSPTNNTVITNAWLIIYYFYPLQP